MATLEYFHNFNYKEPIQLDAATLIQNPSLMVKTHLSTIKANLNSQIYKSYLARLEKVREYLECNGL